MSKQHLELVGLCSSTPRSRSPLTADQATELARSFKAVADPVRLRLLSLIAAHDGGEACVCDLTDAFEVSGPTISHHLKVLREAGLITGDRRGTWIYYRIQPDLLARLARVLSVDPRSAAQPDTADAPAGASSREVGDRTSAVGA